MVLIRENVELVTNDLREIEELKRAGYRELVLEAPKPAKKPAKKKVVEVDG